MTDPSDLSAAPGAPEVRVQKILALLGFGSRRNCETLIESGRVSVNGRTAVLGSRAVPGVDVIAVDGAEIGSAPDLVYYLVNKPAGVICSAADTGEAPRIIDLVPAEPRVFSVGRLDRDSEGLIILTNDGTLAHRLTHPSVGVEKEYVVRVECGESGVPARAINRLRAGVELEDGLTAPARVGQPTPGLLKIVIHEGRNRQIRRMCEAVGHPVVRLVRTRIGDLTDTTLQPGEFRPLARREVLSLYGQSSRA